jgi:hypothetical protein
MLDGNPTPTQSLSAGENVVIAEGTRVCGHVIIGPGAELGPGAIVPAQVVRLAKIFRGFMTGLWIPIDLMQIRIRIPGSGIFSNSGSGSSMFSYPGSGSRSQGGSGSSSRSRGFDDQNFFDKNGYLFNPRPS